MREIKFDFVARNIHFDEIHHNVYTLDQIWDGREILTWLKSGNCEMIARRLYTGLKDKNGVEIYEGDIVKDNMFGIYTVFFSYGGFKLIGVNDLSNQLAFMDSHSNWYEVIGNIYENPELLTPELSSKEKETTE